MCAPPKGSARIFGSLPNDAWGKQLSSSSDMTPSFPYRYVGALGVRWDATLGMYYCRQRWYDPTMQRWISRDKMSNTNRYEYCNSSPTSTIDPSGLISISPELQAKCPKLNWATLLANLRNRLNTDPKTSCLSQKNKYLSLLDPNSNVQVGYQAGQGDHGNTIPWLGTSGQFGGAIDLRDKSLDGCNADTITNALMHELTHIVVFWMRAEMANQYRTQFASNPAFAEAQLLKQSLSQGLNYDHPSGVFDPLIPAGFPTTPFYTDAKGGLNPGGPVFPKDYQPMQDTPSGPRT